ncbi:hypothetical protein E4U42_007558 [Claviceps africana]|uniref:Uncharacterized protein n=1 Tax=Claviceps africana TaxID=83212 RepID=A0A8K0J3Q8_9HYPO|nr:hypothetical protein E4U42_007558 [Claviceps africana]
MEMIRNRSNSRESAMINVDGMFMTRILHGIRWQRAKRWGLTRVLIANHLANRTTRVVNMSASRTSQLGRPSWQSLAPAKHAG